MPDSKQPPIVTRRAFSEASAPPGTESASRFVSPQKTACVFGNFLPSLPAGILQHAMMDNPLALQSRSNAGSQGKELPGQPSPL